MPANFLLLLKKCLIQELRSWKWTLIEMLVVTMIFTIVVVDPVKRSKDYLLEQENKRVHFIYNRGTLYNLDSFRRFKHIKLAIKRFSVLYTPYTEFTGTVMTAVKTNLALRSIQAVDNHRTINNLLNKNTILAGVIFNYNETAEAIPEKLSVTLRFPYNFRTIETDVADDQLWITRCSGIAITDKENDSTIEEDLYVTEGFLPLQHQIFETWLRLLMERNGNGENYVIPHININYMYLPKQAENCFYEDTWNITWFLYHFTFFITFLNMIRRYGHEREANIQEHHWIYGYQARTQWLAHTIISFLHILFLNLIIIIAVCILYTMEYDLQRLIEGKLFILFIFLSLYSIMLILFAIILAIIFNNAINAVLCGATIWLASYALFSLISDYVGIHWVARTILPNVFFNNFFPLGTAMIIDAENSWNDMKIVILLLNQCIHIFMLLLFAIVLNFFLPGFYMQRTGIWAALVCGRSRRKPNPQKTVVTLDRRNPSWNHFEYGPQPGEEKLYIKNVVTFHPKRSFEQKLKNITMRFFKGEITVILGAYDNAKTMLITCLCGWYKPVVGHIYFDGIKDIYQNWSEYSATVDVCMENNALFHDLSVYETLNYFAAVKQKNRDLQQIDLETSKWLIILNNAKIHSNDKIKDLSFSQQRLVALCCTLTCDTSNILLNEPTHHMTHADQLLYWQVLKQEKLERAIIMTTVSIDEAEAIGDRIGIINDGSLVAYGSQFFLKTNFGVGFNLIILKDPLSSSNPITNVIRQYMPNVNPDNQIGDEVFYKFPADGRYFFQKLLLELEENADTLGIISIRMVGSELSEVYMTLGLDNSLKQNVPEITQTLKFINETPSELKRQQCYAMLYKKMIHQAPNILPVAMIFVVIFLILIINQITSIINVFKEPPSKIIVGYHDTQTIQNIPDSLKNCSYWELKIKKDHTEKWINRNHNNLIFDYNDIVCGSFNTTYEQHVRERKTYERLGAVEIHKPRPNISIWINPKIFHTAPLILNMAHNYILRNLFPNEINRSAAVINYPKSTPTHIKLNLQYNRVIYVRIPLSIGIIMPITTSCFVITIVEERHSNLLTLQRNAGVNMCVLWMVSILWDLCTFFAFSVVYTLIMSLTTISSFGFAEQIMALLFINIYGLGTLAIIYLLARFMGPSKAKAFLLTLIWQLATGLCAYVFYWDVLKSEGVYYYIFLFSPIFALLDCFSRLHMSSVEQTYCTEVCLTYKGCDSRNICELIPRCCFDRYFMWESPGILTPLMFMLLSTLLTLIIFYSVHIHENEQLYSLSPSKREKRLGTFVHSYDDNDVTDERVRIAELTKSGCKAYNVLADQLEHHIPLRSHQLNTISFALDKYMCMGIYGAHYAGKSHLIRQLVGEEKIRFGELYIDGKDVKHESSKALKSLGYCSQNYSLCEIFTPRQLFMLMFLIKGVPVARISEKLREISSSLELRNYMGIRIINLEMAIQRKVCVALALIVYNKVLVLDEPTYGLPAKERRVIWNVLRYARYCGKTVIVSSNDSLECETLADYIIVIHRGDLLAIGSPQYIRQKFTRGFYLHIKLLTDGETANEAKQNLQRDVQNLIRFASFLHEESQLIYRCANYLSFYIPIEDIAFSYLYGSIEKNRRRLNISNYTLGQGTLLNALQNILTTRLQQKPFLKKRQKTNQLQHILH